MGFVDNRLSDPLGKRGPSLAELEKGALYLGTNPGSARAGLLADLPDSAEDPREQSYLFL